MRGEYSRGLPRSSWQKELPPRARRIQGKQQDRRVDRGTTSACAENTLRGAWQQRTRRNYLRVRGEYLRLMEYRKALLELPPRARRIHDILAMCSKNEGTTSACAENTFQTRGDDTARGNYLRVRGEYLRFRLQCLKNRELPPRARRIRCIVVREIALIGTTSACAENTFASCKAPIWSGNYLRVRGEY